MKIILNYILLAISITVFAKNKPVFLFDKDHQDSIILKDGAKIENGILKLNGKKGYAEFKHSTSFDFSDSGMTLVSEVKLLEEPKKENYIIRDMLFSKGYEFIFASEGTRLYYNFKDPKRWAATFWGGSTPKRNQYVQFACVVEHLNDITQAEVGYRVSFYINGKIEARGKFMYVKPKHNNQPIQIGCGFGGGTWLLNGQIAKAAVYNKPLTENEISQLMQKSSYVKVVEHDIKAIDKTLRTKLNSLTLQTKTPQAKFLMNAVTLALHDGFNTQNVDILPNQQLLKSNLSIDDLLKQWQNKQTTKGLKVLSNSQIALVTANKDSNGTGFPIYGLYDKKAQRSIFGRKAFEWEINALTSNKKPITFTSFTTPWKIINITKDAVSIQWNVANNIKAYSTITLNKNRLESNFKIENTNKNIRIEDVTFPKVRFQKLPFNDALTYPSMSGILIKNPTQEQFTGGQEGHYPSGKANMQFSVYYDDKSAIYFAFEDPFARSKYYSVKGNNNNIVCTWNSIVGHTPQETKGGNNFTTSGKFVIELFKGDWFDGGQIYKKFLAEKSIWWIKDLPKTSTPQWYRNLCIRILGVKCSFFPKFAKTKEEVIKLRKYFELPIGFHWYGWDDLNKGRWPHFYPKDFTLDALKELQSYDVFVKPYIDTRLWRVQDGKDGKSDWMYSSHGKKFAIKQKNGKEVIEMYSGPHAVECPAAVGWQDYIVNLVDRLASYNFNAIYHDQVATSRFYPCYDANHNHLLGGGDVWFEKGYKVMFEKIRKLKEKYPNLAHDTEEASDPYIKAMDGYVVWRWTDPGQIPLFASIYSGRIQFTGRLFNHQYPGDYESFFAKVAEQLVTSEQIGWFDYPDLQDPQKRLFVKKIGHLRNALISFFNEGDMQHPLAFEKPIPLLKSKWGAVGNFSLVTTPKVRHGVYLRKDGIKMVVFVNSTKENITIMPKLSLGKNSLAICREGLAKAQLTTQIPKISLKPFSSEVWLIGEAKNLKAAATPIALTMDKISKFTSNINHQAQVVIPSLGNNKPMLLKGNSKFNYLVENIKLEKDATYSFSCQIRKTGSLSPKKIEHRIVIYSRNQNKKFTMLAKVGENVPTDGQWHNCQITFKVPNNVNNYQMYLFNCNATGIVEVKYPVFIQKK